MTEQELRQYYNLITDVWKFLRTHSDVKNGDEYWNTLINDADAITDRYGQARIAKDFVLSVISELERSSRGKCTLIRP